MARTLEFEGHAAWAEGASALPKLTTAMIHAYPAHDEDAPEPHHHQVLSGMPFMWLVLNRLAH